MWVTSKDYETFVTKCHIIYFQVDLQKLMDELFIESQSLFGVALSDLNKRCLDDYHELLDNCPEDMSFEEYVLKEVSADFPITSEIMCKIHRYFNQ